MTIPNGATRRSLFAWILLVLGAIWSGCADVPDDGDVVLKIVWMGPELETYGVWKAGFEAEHPGVTIEQQYVSYDQGPTFYNTMIQGDNLPDLGFLFMGMIPEYAERGVLEPLDAFMSAAERAEWIDVALSAGEYKGKTYGVPLVGANRTLYVRREWMQETGAPEAPTTSGRGPRAGECAQPAARALWVLYRRWTAETSDAGSDRNDVGFWSPLLRPRGHTGDQQPPSH